MKNIRIFYLKIFIFLVVKLSIYLNRRVFVMAMFSKKEISIGSNLRYISWTNFMLS